MWILYLSTALAQVNPFDEADESEIFKFEDELVTVASRYAQTVRKAPSIVTVITADDIRKRGYRTVADALRSLPGFYLWRGPEGHDLAAIRGVVSADNNKMLIMVDGKPWYDGIYTHGFVGDYLPIGHVRQIEVIKGPGSAIYGTNAFTGVVNIVTFSGADLSGAKVNWMVGSGRRSDVVATVGERGKLVGFETSFSAYARVLNQVGDGLSLNEDLDINVVGADPKRGLSLGGKWTLGGFTAQMHHVDYSHSYLNNEIDAPLEASGNQLDIFDLQYHDSFFSATWDLEPTDRVTISPNFWSQRHNNPGTYFYDTGGDNSSLETLVLVDAQKDTRRWGFGIDANLNPSLDHVLVVGAGMENVVVNRAFDLQIDSQGNEDLQSFRIVDTCNPNTAVGFYRNSRICTPPQLRNLFAYAQYTWTIAPQLELTAGGRFDKRIPSNDGEQPDDGAFTPSLSPRAGLLFVPNDRFTAKLLYGRAFRAPNAREFLTQSVQFSQGNLELLPETINTIETQLATVAVEGLQFQVDGSYSILANEIDKVAANDGTLQYCNLAANLNILGAEAGFTVDLDRIQASATYSLTSASYAASGETSPSCPNVKDPYAGRKQYEFPPHMGKADATLSITDQISVSLLGEVYSQRNREEWTGVLDGEPFVMLHLAGDVKEFGPNQALRTGFSVRNFLDTNWNYGTYRDDNKPVAPIQGAGRALLIRIEADL